jgi:hypothetical protein
MRARRVRFAKNTADLDTPPVSSAKRPGRWKTSAAAEAHAKQVRAEHLQCRLGAVDQVALMHFWRRHWQALDDAYASLARREFEEAPAQEVLATQRRLALRVRALCGAIATMTADLGMRNPCIDAPLFLAEEMQDCPQARTEAQLQSFWWRGWWCIDSAVASESHSWPELFCTWQAFRRKYGWQAFLLRQHPALPQMLGVFDALGSKNQKEAKEIWQRCRERIMDQATRDHSRLPQTAPEPGKRTPLPSTKAQTGAGTDCPGEQTG